MCTAIIGFIMLMSLLVRRLISGPSSMKPKKQAKCPFRFLARKETEPVKQSADGLGWEENFLFGSHQHEVAFIDQAAQDIHRVQQNNRKSGKAACIFRAFHAKPLAAMKNAELHVAEDIPAELRVGILQPGKKYSSTLRFSNAAGTMKSDLGKDLRGIALRVHTEEGEHDLLATNGRASHARNAWQFIAFALAMSGSKLLMPFRLIWSVGLFEAVRMIRTASRQASRKINSAATETYFSRAAYAVGERAVKFQLTPCATEELGIERTPEYLHADLVERLKRGPVVFNLQVQYFKNETETPVEDGSVEWNTPLITIAQVVIPQQDLNSQEAVAVQVEVDNLEFNPWNVTTGFRPLGSQNRARLLVYKASAALRKGGSDSGLSQKGQNSMSHDDQQRRCPFGFGGKNQPDGTQPDGSEAKIWRPRSRRVGFRLVSYVLLNAFYWVMETINRGLSRDPNRKVSWDKWPTPLGLMYLLAKIWYVRSNALTDPYDYATNDVKDMGPEPEAAKHGYLPDGSWALDNDDPQMGTPGTRFGSNIPPKKVRPDVEEMTPSAREAGKLRWRRLDENGKEITIPALILSDLAGGWIQFQFHNFGGNTLRDPVTQCPHLMKRDPKDNWPGNVARIDRTTADPTRVTDNGRPTPINEKTVAWVQGQIYGNNGDEQNALRSFEGGKFALEADLRLPEDPNKPGIDHTGFNNNYNPLLSFLHWLFVQEHNAIADHYAYFYPEWDDEKLFQMARKVNVAQIARIHTIQWTEDLLQHPTLQLGMHTDWYGFLGQRTKMYLMRLAHRSPFVARLIKPLQGQDAIWGMPGSKWEHHDGPFQVPKHFRMVYRLHELILSEREIVQPGTDKLLERVDLINFVHSNTRPLVAKYGYETLAYSFVRKSCGALTLHNFPRALTQFENQQDGELTDLAERDLLRERTDGTGTYNEFRQSVGEPPVTSFLELTGGDAELARELEIKYEGDVDKVDAGIGILAEPKPAGFALGFCQFYQFVLNAPRRVKSNRHLTEGFTYAEYAEGMDWVEHGGGMLGAMARHLPGLRSQMEGVTRAFSPWKETETFPHRQLQETHKDTANVFKADLRTFVLAVVTAVLATMSGAIPAWVATGAVACITLIPLALTVRRMLAMRFMQICWKKCYTDKRGFMFGTLTRAENSINSAAHFGALHALAVMVGSLGLAAFFGSSFPLLSALLVLVSISSLGVRKWSKSFAANAQVLRIALRNRMRDGQPQIDPCDIAGSSAFEKRFCFNRELPARVRASASKDNHVYSCYGDVDMEEFERLFRTYAPGRDHLTAYDFNRMAEQESLYAGSNFMSRFVARLSMLRRSHEVLHLFGDTIVEEDKKLVPAISKGMLLSFYQGTAQAQLKREHEEGDTDPSPQPRQSR